MLADAHFVPQLNTPFTEPLHLLEQHFLTHRVAIEAWFQSQWQLTLPPVYGSIDLRHAGFKLAPIDMNLFPAGFNNLNPAFLSVSIAAAKKIIEKTVPSAKKILILPESHTRNMPYWENVLVIHTILTSAGFDVALGNLSDGHSVKEISLPSGHRLTVNPLSNQDGMLYAADFLPDVILLNNDLSSGIPSILHGLKQPIIPPAELGWSQRLKSEHFQYYADLTKEFAQTFDIDPWLISPLFRHCGCIDFMQQEGLDCLTAHAETLFNEIQKKYDDYHIPLEPFLIVKADAGTYGMAVMTVRNINELSILNRKQRTKMAMTKGGQPVHRVIIQEGVYTFETLGPDQAVAEPVVYLWGDTVVGGFYRVHENRGTDENLNAPGMRFHPLAFSQPCHEPSKANTPNDCQNRYYIYGIVAQLSMLAAAREINDQQKKAV